MTDQVKYQLERAQDALRTALEVGAKDEDPYLLRNIVETLNTINGWTNTSRFNFSVSDSVVDPYEYYN